MLPNDSARFREQRASFGRAVGMRDRLAVAVLVMGLVFVLAGVIGLVREGEGSDPEISTAVDTTTARSPTSQPGPGAETPVAETPVVDTATSALSTTTPAPSTTTPAPSSTSSVAPSVPTPVDAIDEPDETPPVGPAIDPDDPVAEPNPLDDTAAAVTGFFDAYVAAIDAGEVDFLFDTLHPLVLDQPTADLCRAFIEREILALENYRTNGDIGEPVSQDVAGTIVPQLYSIPVAFEFQGQTFEGTATFAPVEGEMRWFTTCR